MRAGDLVDGRYRLEAMLGRGGMGVVWQALDSRLERRVALKMLHPANAPTDPAMHARFAREARLLATLDHPTVVSIYDYSAEHDPPFLVMQLIDGQTLEAEVAHAPLERRRVRKLLAPVADALVYAHGRGIVHRDLKPANVLLDRDGRVRVTDFGLARLAFGETSITVGTQLIGSPEYWAPEQAAGRDTTTAADLYALGVILFLLASGELPFPAGEDRIQAGFRRIHEDAPSLGLAAPGLPRRDPELVELCDALLSREPTARPTAAATAEWLRRSDAPVTAPRRPDAPTVVVSAADAPTPAATVPLRAPVETSEAETRRPAVAAAPRTAGSPAGRGPGGRRAVALALLGLTLALAGTAVAFTALDEDEPDTAATATTATAAATGDGGPTTAATTADTDPPPVTTAEATVAAPTTTEPTEEERKQAEEDAKQAKEQAKKAEDERKKEAEEAAKRREEDEGRAEEDDDAALAAAVPATFRSESCRFRHPEGWSASTRDARRGASHIDNVVRDPAGGREIVCARDQRATSAAAIANRVRGFYVGDRGYREHFFGPATVAGRDAFLWEYTNGGSRYKEAFFAPGVGFRFGAPAGDWPRSEQLADQVLASYDGP